MGFNFRYSLCIALSSLAISTAVVGTVSGQEATDGLSSMTRVLGPKDGDVAVPSLLLPLGSLDAVALQAILDFIKSINGGNWRGMQGAGTLTGPDQKTTSQATLTVLGGDDYRLDVSAQEGQTSLRIQGVSGQVLESDGSSHGLPAETAAQGLLALPKLLASSFPGTQTSVLDRGLVSIGSGMLHRITIENPLDSTATTVSAADQISVIDLYFDPASHLLIKSVSLAQLNSMDRDRYVKAITYSNYQTVNNVLLPLTLSQTLNGQLQWSFQLTDVHLQPAVDAHYFQF